MDFFRSKMGTVVVIACVLVIIAVLCVFMLKNGSQQSPEGTLVTITKQEVCL